MSTQTLGLRAQQTIAGALAGLASWFLADQLSDLVDGVHLTVLLQTVISGFFVTLLALSGPKPPLQVLPVSLAISLVAGGLVWWSSFRFDIDDTLYLEDIYVVVLLAWSLLVTVSTKYAASYVANGTEWWLEYPNLFDEAWNLIVRFFVAWIFVGIFWGVLGLSHLLLDLVGVSIIEDALEVEPVPYVVTGAALGLALAVCYELRHYVSPFLVLRLLRLLLPVVLLVLLVFVGSLPFAGWAETFRGMSGTAILASVAVGAIILVSVAVDRTDKEAVQLRFMKTATRLLATFAAIPALLAAYGLWLRVNQYGWTPERVNGAVAIALLLAYTLSYALFSLGGRNWMARIRASNIFLGVGIVVASALLLTPVLNPLAISTKSQVSRIINHKVEVPDAAIWEIAKDWGKAGKAGAERLKELPETEYPGLHAALERAENGTSRYAYTETFDNLVQVDYRRELAEALIVRPKERVISDDLLIEVSEWRIEEMHSACVGAEMECVAVFGNFDPETEEDVLFFIPTREESGRYEVYMASQHNGMLDRVIEIAPRNGASVFEYQIDKLINDDLDIRPTKLKSLWIEDIEILPFK